MGLALFARGRRLCAALAFEHEYAWLVVCSLLLVELLGGLLILHRVRYTEIDWKAYMQEVQGVLDGDYDYEHLRGGTGPLVYPAGFVWLFSALHAAHGADPACCRLPANLVTESARCVSGGGDIHFAQLLFLLLYLCTQAVVLDLFRRSRALPPWALALVCLSPRMHSLYLLRLFNDCVAMLFAYAFLHCFVSRRHFVGTLLFSAAVSVKMNALLFAPAAAVLLLRAHGWPRSLMCAALFVGVQLVLAAPFLDANASGYARKAFELSRAFEQRWSVNWQFVPAGLFASAAFARVLLVGHVALLVGFAQKHWCAAEHGLPPLLLRWRAPAPAAQQAPASVLATLLVCNFVGVAAARTLHYQFYAWYFHAVPFLLWRTRLPTPVRLMLWAAIEGCFNVYPPTPFSSGVLQLCHGALLCALWSAPADRKCLGSVWSAPTDTPRAADALEDCGGGAQRKRA